MQIVQNLELAGYYRLEKIRNGRRELVADWFPNIITNNGLDLFATGYTQKFQAVYVGTGSSTPTANDTQLENQIATTSGASISSGIDTTGRYVYMNAQYTFAAGGCRGQYFRNWCRPDRRKQPVFASASCGFDGESYDNNGALG